MTARKAMSKTPFSLAFEIQTIIPIQRTLPTFYISERTEMKNDDIIRRELEVLEE